VNIFLNVLNVKSDVSDIKLNVLDIKSDVSEIKFNVLDAKSDVSEIKLNVLDARSDVSDIKFDVLDVKSDVLDIKLGLNPVKAKNETVEVGVMDRKGLVKKLVLVLERIGWSSLKVELKTSLFSGGGSATTCTVLNSGGIKQILLYKSAFTDMFV
jgi:hypothetical protein